MCYEYVSYWDLEYTGSKLILEFKDCAQAMWIQISFIGAVNNR